MALRLMVTCTNLFFEVFLLIISILCGLLSDLIFVAFWGFALSCD